MTLLRLVMLIVILAAAVPPASSKAADPALFGGWAESSTMRVDHSAWGAFLGKYVVASADGVNRIRYGAVSEEDRRSLEDYIARMAAVVPTSLGKDEAFAYWANLYNALTVDLILERYPVKSIREIKPSLLAIGPWKMVVVAVNGREFTLDDIEHGVLRANWKDPRTHYALNCASIGCPNLRAEPFVGETLNDTLDQAARDYVNHRRGAHFDQDGRLVASSIYKWFREDFGGSEQGVIDHLRAFSAPEFAGRLRQTRDIAKYKYDWTLNDAE